MSAYLLLQLNVLMLLGINKFSKNINFAHYGIIILLIIFSGFRYGVGNDYTSYYEKIGDILNGYEVNIEPSIVVLSKLASYFSLNEQFVFLICSIITIIGFGTFIKRYTKNLALSWIIFISFGTFFLGSLNLVKQYVAIAIFAYSIKYIVNRQAMKYVFTILFASSFHFSALFLLPIYLIYRQFSIKHYVLILLGFSAFIFSFESIISYTKYAIYLDDEWASSMNNERNMALTYIFIFINLFIILTQKYIRTIDNYHIFINLSFLSFLTISMSLLMSYLPNMFFYRMNNYFMIAYIVIPTFYILNIKSQYLKFIGFSIISLLMILYFNLSVQNGAGINLIPYEINFNILK